MDIGAYFTKLKVLWDELQTYQQGVDYQQQETVMQFLMGLNESYAQVRTQILLMDPLPSLSKVFSLVIQAERQRTIVPISGTLDSLSFAVNSVLENSIPKVAAVTNTGRGRRDRPMCTYCGILGH